MSEPQLVLPDVNALVALCVTNHLHHRDAHAFLATVESWATTPVTEAALYRLLLNPQVTTAEHSVADVDASSASRGVPSGGMPLMAWSRPQPRVWA